VAHSNSPKVTLFKFMVEVGTSNTGGSILKIGEPAHPVLISHCPNERVLKKVKGVISIKRYINLFIK